MSSFVVNAILEKTENRDKDFRYMATSDLLTELSKETFKPDSDGERRMCKCLLKLINDQSSDVQSLAVKCLSPLVRKIHEERVDEIMTALSTSVLSGSEEQRDISSIGLKTVVVEMPSSMAASAIRQLTPQLIEGVQRDKLEVKLECLEVLNDVLRRFAASLSEDEARACLAALFGELTSVRAAARKRAIACIASLSASLPDRMLDAQLVGAIFTQMTVADMKLDLRRTYIQVLSAISRSGGYRLAKQVDKVIPLILQQCMPAKSSMDAEMLEACLQAFESFVLRCPKEVGAFQSEVGTAALTYLAYDPNYADDDGDDMEDEEEEEEDEDEEAEDYSDDDDVSWKVRRAAAKVLSSLVLSRPDRLPELLPMLLPTLIHRFREREENVKMDIFATFNDLLTQVARANEADAASADAMAVDDGAGGTTGMLLAEVPKVVRAAAKQLKQKSTKTRVAAFHCLRQLVTTLPGCLAAHAAVIVPGLDKALKDGSSNAMRIEALLFFEQALSSHPPPTFQPHVALLLPSVVALADDRYYKTVSEALRVLSEIVRLLRPDPPAVSFAYDAFVPKLYAVVEKRLQAQDQDQEVKECAISCMGLIVYHLADHPAVQLKAVLPLLLERMRNEITRVVAVKTLSLVADAKLDVALSTPTPTGPVLTLAVHELCSFLRKSNRPLRQASLTALDKVIGGHAASVPDADVAAAITELSALVSDADLHVAHLALSLARTICVAKPTQMAACIKEDLLPRAMALLQSSLLQGVALRSLLAFLAELVRQQLPSLDFNGLTTALLALPTSSSLSRHSLSAVAQAVAACCSTATAAQTTATVQHFVGQLTAGAPAVFPLLSVGEIGKCVDLSSDPAVLETIVKGFDSAEEETRSAASLSLGNVAAGAPSVFLPTLLARVGSGADGDGSGGHDYLMLHAFKEMLGSGGASLASFAPALLPKLLAFAERDEEGVRNVVSECLGRLAAIAPETVVPLLVSLLPSKSASTRLIVISCVRFMVTEVGAAPLPALLQVSLLELLKTLEDEDLKVRRGALLALNSLAHNKPSAVRELLPSLLPLLYAETVKRPELVHQVDLGPFKHTVDDGLEARKAAFECMETLLARCPERLDFAAFLAHLQEGLSDDGDIKLLCHRMIIELTALSAATTIVVANLDAMCDPLRKTLVATLKDNAVKQQIERHNELLRSAMRAARALEKLPDAESVTKFAELCRTTLRGPKLGEKYAAICAEEEKMGED